MRAGQAAIARKDGPSAVLMVASARSQLGLIYERYQAPSLSEERALIRNADLDLASIQNDLRANDAMAAMRLALWPGQAAILAEKLQANEGKSLFDPASSPPPSTARGKQMPSSKCYSRSGA